MLPSSLKRLLTVLLLAFTISSTSIGFIPITADAQASGAAGSVAGIVLSCTSLSSMITNAVSSFLGVGTEVPVGEGQLRAKECTDGIAWALAKTLLAQITNSVITWINSGFEGNPFYVRNGDSFFRNLANEQIQLTLGQIQGAGNYYFDSIRASIINGVRSGLQGTFTSTFDQDVSRALCNVQNSDNASYYLRVSRGTNTSVEGPFSTNTQCLSRRNQVIQEPGTGASECIRAQNSICLTGLGQGSAGQRLQQGRTVVNAFTSGQIPFRWDLFNSLTQNCGNNPYCSQIAAEQAIQRQIGNTVARTTQELAQGSGFLGQRECADRSYQDRLADWNNQLSDPSLANDPDVIAQIGPRPTCPSWTIKTPGKIIADKLTGSLGSTDRQLELADELNESIAAVFTALINKLIEKGLSSFDGKGNDPYDTLINDPRSGFQFDQGTTLDQVNNPEDCEGLGGTFNTDTNSCDFTDTGSTGLPTFPWTIDGVTYDTIDAIVLAFPGRCVNIDGIQVLPGTEPCLEGTSSDGGGVATDYTGVMMVTPQTVSAGTAVTITITNAKPNVGVEVSDGDNLIAVGVTDQGGSYSASYTPGGEARTITLHADAEDTTIPTVDLIVTAGSTGGTPPTATSTQSGYVAFYPTSTIAGVGSITTILAVTGTKPNSFVTIHTSDGSMEANLSTDASGNTWTPNIIQGAPRTFTLTVSGNTATGTQFTYGPTLITVGSLANTAFAPVARLSRASANTFETVDIVVSNARANSRAYVTVVRPDNTAYNLESTLTDAQGNKTFTIPTNNLVGTYSLYPSVEGTVAIPRLQLNVSAQ